MVVGCESLLGPEAHDQASKKLLKVPFTLHLNTFGHFFFWLGFVVFVCGV